MTDNIVDIDLENQDEDEGQLADLIEDMRLGKKFRVMTIFAVLDDGQSFVAGSIRSKADVIVAMQKHNTFMRTYIEEMPDQFDQMLSDEAKNGLN